MTQCTAPLHSPTLESFYTIRSMSWACQNIQTGARSSDFQTQQSAHLEPALKESVLACQLQQQHLDKTEAAVRMMAEQSGESP